MSLRKKTSFVSALALLVSTLLLSGVSIPVRAADAISEAIDAGTTYLLGQVKAKQVDLHFPSDNTVVAVPRAQVLKWLRAS